MWENLEGRELDSMNILDKCIPPSTVISPIIPKTWKQPESLPVDTWIKIVVEYISKECYSDVNKR